MAKTDNEKKQPQRYFKEQLVKSGRFSSDAAQAVLKDNVEYTDDEAADEIRKYLEREVK